MAKVPDGSNPPAANQQNKYNDIDEAKTYLRGERYDSERVTSLFGRLAASSQFGYAAEVILKYLGELQDEGKELTDADHQGLVMNIYKDSSLSSYFKYDKAINILRSDCELDRSQSCETLGLAGAIYKYKFRFDHQIQNLYMSLTYYEKGYKLWVKSLAAGQDTDYGYTAINYAFVCEMLLSQFLGQFGDSETISEEIVNRFEKCRKVRMQVLTTYIKDIHAKIPEPIAVITNDWQYATLAEAFFGLRMYKQALRMIAEYTSRQKMKWRLKSFTQQLYQVSGFQDMQKKYDDGGKNLFKQTEINQAMQNECLAAIDGKKPAGNEPADYARKRGGKKGLALSGGGFRAALFEIGVLAALAETDELRDVEVISCVSGGSIIGTYYYLHLQKLLQKNTDAEITKEHYIALVKMIETEFLLAVQQNLRMHIFTNLIDNLRMVFSKTYSRSYRLGSLYQRYFYLPLFNRDAAEKRKHLYMEDLKIKPMDNPDFNIGEHNWERTNKVPQLILNATCLNTGHNWQFTSTWMGEPPAWLSKSFDVKKRLRRMYYKDAPGIYKNFPVGNAVAASSCVPVLFEPLVLKELYPGVDVELVDGGVHDNQGIASILEQECDCIYVCDGSSQLPDDAGTTANEFSLFFRVDNVAQERVRETQLLDLKARKYASIIRDLKIMHLKKELAQEPLSWINSDDKPRAITQHQVKQDDDLLDFGLMKNVQKLLSEVRTDLDSFNDAEAMALMYSGYRQTLTEFEANPEDQHNGWKFLQVADYCTKPDKQKPLTNLLKVSASVPFKLVKKYKGLRWFLYALGLAAVIAATRFVINNQDKSVSINYGAVAFVVLTFVLGFFSKLLVKMLDVKGYIKKLLVLITLATVGWLVFNIYILFFNPWYNWGGKLKRFK